MAKINIYKIADINDLLQVTKTKSKMTADAPIKIFFQFLKKYLTESELINIENRVEFNWVDSSAVRAWINSLHELREYLIGELEVPNSCAIAHLQLDSGSSNRIPELLAWQVVGLFSAVGCNSINLSFPPPRQLVIGELGVFILDAHSSNSIGGWALDLPVGRNPELIQCQMNGIIKSSYGWHPHPTLQDARLPTIPWFDPSLTDPRFHDSPIVKGELFIENWISHLKIAYDELASYSEIASEITKKLVSTILPLVCGERSIGSASRQEALGLIFLPAVLDQDDQILECLLHETMHQYLFRIEECGSLFGKESPKEEDYFSPWRKDKRPLRMTLHGSFVFTAVADMYIKFPFRNKCEMISPAEAQKRAYQRFLEARLALKVVKKYAVLSKFGSYVCTAIEADHRVIDEHISLSEKDKLQISLAVEKHSQKYANYLQ